MSALVKKPIDSKGHWLTPTAADSYLRMVAAAKTGTGLVVGGRTYAEQERLYAMYKAGHGNLAARPGTSLHESGLAVDVTTGSALQRWMSYGSRYNKVTKTGTTRAAAFGWFRTVPSEPWHFRYYPEHDKHRNDKPAPVIVVKPPVVVPPVVVTPPATPIPTLARTSTINCHGWNLPEHDWTAADEKALEAEVKRLNCSIYTLTECPEYMRDALRAAMPGGADRWRVVTRGDNFHQAIMFDRLKWKFISSDGDVFGPTSYHGGVWAVFEQTVTKARLAVGVYHLPPNAVSSSADQHRYLQDFLAKAPKVNARLAGGDGADSSSWADGWQDARIIAATSSNRAACTYGASIKDRVFMLGAVVRIYSVGPIVHGLDHRAVLAQITIPGTIPTN